MSPLASRSLPILAALAISPACSPGASQDDASADDTSTGSSSSSSDPDTSPPTASDVTGATEAPTSSSESSSSSESGDDTGPPQDTQSRVVVLADLDTPGVFELYRYDYDAGELVGPTKINPELPPDTSISIAYPLDDRHVIYGSSNTSGHYFVVDVSAELPAEAVYLNVGLAPINGFGPLWPALLPDGDRVVFSGGGSDEAQSTYRVTGIDDSPAAPELLVPGTGADSSRVAFDAASTRMAFPSETTPGAMGIVIASLDAEAPAPLVDVTPDAMIGDDARPVSFLAEGGGLVFRRVVGGGAELWVTRVVDGEVLDPVRLHDTLGPDEYLDVVLARPGSEDVVYRSGSDDGFGRLYWVDIDGASVAEPVEITTDATGHAAQYGPQFSPDGRYLSYCAEQPASTCALTLVDFDGDSPAAPTTVVTSAPAGALQYEWFARDSRHLYYTYSPDLFGGGSSHTWRVPVNATGLGEEQLATPLDGPGFVLGTSFSRDSAWMFFSAWNPNVSKDHDMYLADVSGEQPGTPEPIGPSVGADSLGGAQFDPNSDVFGMTIARRGPGFDAVWSLRLYSRYDLDAPIVEIDPDVRTWFFVPAS